MFDKDEIKNGLEKILIYYGAVPPQKAENWTCIALRHENPYNNLTVKNNICCCHCGLKGDSFSVIAEMENLNNKDDFLLIAKKAAEILNLPIKFNRQIYEIKTKKHEQKNNCGKILSKYNLTKIITENFEKIKKEKYIYFKKRGFNEKIISKYKLLVSNPKKIFPDEIIPKLNNIWAYEYIIPVWQDGEVVNCILRRNDWKNKDNNSTLNLKGFNVELFNSDYLNIQDLKYIFICEGWADALSFESLGYKAIAINSITMINRLINLIINNIDKLKNNTFFIIFDQDEKEWGQIASKKLVKQLKENQLKAFNLSIKKPYKDVNEYYCKDLKAFKKSINYLMHFKYVNKGDK